MPIEVEMEKNVPELINEKEIIEAGLRRNPPIRKELVAKYHIFDVDDSLESGHSFWSSGSDGKFKDYESRLIRISNWVIMAKKENNEINTFIAMWIGFNGLYNLFSGESPSERGNGQDAKFENIITKLLINDANKIVETYTTHLDHLEMIGHIYKSNNIGQSLRNKRENATYIEIIVEAIRCVYTVRNKVFHEALYQGDFDNTPYRESLEYDENINMSEEVKLCLPFLEVVIMACLHNVRTYN